MPLSSDMGIRGSRIKQAVATGNPRPGGYVTLMGMLEERTARLQALRAGRPAPSSADQQVTLDRVPSQIPRRVQPYLEDLERLLVSDQVTRGKEILASLGTEVVIAPDGTAEKLR